MGRVFIYFDWHFYILNYLFLFSEKCQEQKQAVFKYDKYACDKHFRIFSCNVPPNLQYSTFCDIYSLGSGKFNQDLITAIDNCTNFILVLGAFSLERCTTDDSDWLYNEIKEALTKKRISSVCLPMMSNFPRAYQVRSTRSGIKMV